WAAAEPCSPLGNLPVGWLDRCHVFVPALELAVTVVVDQIIGRPAFERRDLDHVDLAAGAVLLDDAVVFAANDHLRLDLLVRILHLGRQRLANRWWRWRIRRRWLVLR